MRSTYAITFEINHSQSDDGGTAAAAATAAEVVKVQFFMCGQIKIYKMKKGQLQMLPICHTENYGLVDLHFCVIESIWL